MVRLRLDNLKHKLKNRSSNPAHGLELRRIGGWEATRIVHRTFKTKANQKKKASSMESHFKNRWAVTDIQASGKKFHLTENFEQAEARSAQNQ